jgi:hypothetical protein
MAVDAWEMAADCARAIEASKDPTRRALVGTLQKLWIELGNKERLLSEQHVLKEMEGLSIGTPKAGVGEARRLAAGLSRDHRKGQPRRGTFIRAVLIDRTAELAGQPRDKFQSGTFRVVLFDPAAIIGHAQASLAVADTSD